MLNQILNNLFNSNIILHATEANEGQITKENLNKNLSNINDLLNPIKKNINDLSNDYLNITENVFENLKEIKEIINSDLKLSISNLDKDTSKQKVEKKILGEIKTSKYFDSYLHSIVVKNLNLKLKTDEENEEILKIKNNENFENSNLKAEKDYKFDLKDYLKNNINDTETKDEQVSFFF